MRDEVALSAWRRAAGNVVRGGLIGTVEVVPGVSGGTVALIVGIYERIIASASHVVSGSRIALADVPRGRGFGRSGTEFRKADWAMVIAVLIGMCVALVLAASQIEGFVHDNPVAARGLFFGLVAASLFVPISMVGKGWRPRYLLAAVLAAAAGFVLTGLPPTHVEPTPVVLVIAAAVAVSALVLPGLSGAFVLLTFGLYEPALAAVNDRELDTLAFLGSGAIIGLALFVKVMQWLLEHRRLITLAVLTGVMAGCLRALWPWQDDGRALLAPGDDVDVAAGLFVVGFAVVVVALLIARRFQHVDTSERTPAEATQ